mgnify:FL=1
MLYFRISIDDDLEPMDPSDYGDPLRCLYRFKIWDHRTEGRIHINKRDLELYKGNPEGSYGKTQGNATLEGAVYGLFAAQDIIHPDGKSGVVYGRDQLTAIAATDKEGNASFLAYTECPGTLWNGSGTEVSAFTGPENLYQAVRLPHPIMALERKSIRIISQKTARSGLDVPFSWAAITLWN